MMFFLSCPLHFSNRLGTVFGWIAREHDWKNLNNKAYQDQAACSNRNSKSFPLQGRRSVFSESSHSLGMVTCDRFPTFHVRCVELSTGAKLVVGSSMTWSTGPSRKSASNGINLSTPARNLLFVEFRSRTRLTFEMRAKVNLDFSSS